MIYENAVPDENKVPNNKVVFCLTCAAIIAANSAATDVPPLIWNNCSWNITREDEEEEAFLHSLNNPYHIMVSGLDWGYKINGL